ncbi:hypothetical protein K3495_g16783, partial [Podosphaera aphanis]
ELPDEPQVSSPQEDPFSTQTSSGPIYEALNKSIVAATTRAKEAEALFGDIASYLDNHWAAPSRSSLPSNQRSALKNLCIDLAAVAARHFDAYTRGNLASKPPTLAAPELIGDHNRYSHTPAPSYANAARHGSSVPAAHNARGQNIQGPSGLQASSRSYRPDDRLFVRLNEESQLRKLSAYAIQSHLRSKLGADSQLLANVQPTKTGFALCPRDGDTSKLKDKIESVGFFGDAALEPA